jgi:hypothetical protein
MQSCGSVSGSKINVILKSSQTQFKTVPVFDILRIRISIYIKRRINFPIFSLKQFTNYTKKRDDYFLGNNAASNIFKSKILSKIFTKILLVMDRIRNFSAVGSGMNSSRLTPLIDCTVLAYFEP